jgi:hypothetical protein
MKNPLVRFIGIVTFAAAALSCTCGLTQDLSKYWPTNEYRSLTCAELAREGREVSKRGFALLGLRAGSGGSDSTQTAPAIVFVWPVTSPVGNQQRTDALALAFKQMDGIEQASVASQCSIRFQRSPAS